MNDFRRPAYFPVTSGWLNDSVLKELFVIYLDSTTSEIREMCDSQATLAKAAWVSEEEMLAYVVQKQGGSKELRLLVINTCEVDKTL